jgi:hypothetical protein
MSLGSVYDELGFLALSRHYFTYLLQRGSTPEMRRVGEYQLERLDDEERERRVQSALHQEQFALALHRASEVGNLVDLRASGCACP